MNFVNNNDYYLGEPGQQKSKAIKNFGFSTDKNFIIINYLDGTQDVKPNTESEMNEILKLMIEQAKYRNDDYYVSSKNESDSFLVAIAIVLSNFQLFVMPIIGRVLPDDHPITIYLKTVTYGLTTAYVLKAKSNIKHKLKDKKDELKKYRIYLEMIDKYQEIPQYSADTLWLYEGIEKLKEKLEPMGHLCINTLDNFTLEDIKKIAQRLEKHNNQKTNSHVRRRVLETPNKKPTNN